MDRVEQRQLSDNELQAIRQITRGAGVGDLDTVIKGILNSNWVIYPVHYAGSIVGGIIRNGADIHTSIAPEFQRKWNPRPYVNSILYKTLEEYGEVRSLSEKSDARGLKWLQKLGFSIISEDENHYYLKLTEIKFKYRSK
jgi:ribosomal protein S18 acetylase RimI-like enzyme